MVDRRAHAGAARRPLVDARALFPLTLAHLGDRAPAATTPPELVQKVCDQHAKGDIPSRAARDLVRYEAMLLELAPSRARAEAPPGDDEPCVIAPHVRVLVFGAALPEMLAALRAGKEAKPRPCRGWLIAWRDDKGLRELEIPRVEGWFLESFREPTAPKDAIEDAQDRAHFEHLWREGILTRAA